MVGFSAHKAHFKMFLGIFGQYVLGKGETALRDSHDSDTPNGTPVLQMIPPILQYSKAVSSSLRAEASIFWIAFYSFQKLVLVLEVMF